MKYWPVAPDFLGLTSVGWRFPLTDSDISHTGTCTKARPMDEDLDGQKK